MHIYTHILMNLQCAPDAAVVQQQLNPADVVAVAAAFDIQAVNLQPNVVSPGGTLNLLVDVNNKQAPGVTAGG